MERLADVTVSAIQQQRSLDFVKWLSCLYETGTPTGATARFLERWPRSDSKELVTKSPGRYRTGNFDPLWGKAAVAPATTQDPAWAGALTIDKLAEAFFDVVRRASLLGKIPGLR